MTTTDRPSFEIIEQETPVFGWIIMARWPSGRSEQLIGVYTTPDAAEEWIAYESESWFAPGAKLRVQDRLGCRAV